MSGKIIMAKEIAKKLIARERGIQLGLSVNTDTLSNSEENEHLWRAEDEKQKLHS